MTASLGDKLPAVLMGLLTGKKPSAVKGNAIPMATIASDGSPCFSMLSFNEIWAAGRSSVRIAPYVQTTAKNLKEHGAVSLLFVDKGLTYYVKGKAELLRTRKIEGVDYAVFDVKVSEVLEDQGMGTAITSGIRFKSVEGGAEAILCVVAPIKFGFCSPWRSGF
ncbi:MAG: pyridoxamine 5'-phosphate oxidase family protein [Thaumarchaeota archaeon]|nr:pyridoxamine 5'-phosphate oxidase family protein [Nitrososphaerota archaeon]